MMETDTFRRRLEWLIAFRVAIVTISLGSLLALDIDKLSSFSEPRNALILGVIVGTYMLTILYSVALRAGWSLERLATIQVIADFGITTVVVAITGGSQSVFVILLFIEIIITSFIRGKLQAYVGAAFSSFVFLGLFFVEHRFIEIPSGFLNQATTPLPEALFTVSMNAGAAFLIAFLSGYLAEKMGGLETRLRREQLNVRQLERLNEDILASLNSGLVTVDRQHRIIFYNQAAEKILAEPLAEKLGRRLDDIFPELQEMMDEAEKTGHLEEDWLDKTPRLERQYERPDGRTIFIGFSVSVLRSARYAASPGGADYDNGRIIVLQDLTELFRLREQKKRSERLAAIGQMAGSMAHEIRNPLASMKGSLELLQSMKENEQGEKQNDKTELMNVLQRDVTRLNNLVTEFLEYGRLRHLERSQIDLEDLLESVLSLFENRKMDCNVDLTVQNDSHSEEFIASVDRSAIEQVLWNLLNNAAEALEKADRDESRIEIELSYFDREYLMISIEDSGEGIDSEDRQNIFEPFFTTKDEGTGLGLATSYRIVEEHGGDLSLASESHLGGARFELKLPTLD